MKSGWYYWHLMKGRQNFGVLFFFRGFYFFSEQVIARFDKRLQKNVSLH